jgi:hypothetical protein
MIEITVENELNNIAYQTVKREDTTSLDEQIREKRKEIDDLKNERTPRPATKREYLDLLDTLQDDLAGLVATIKEVDDQYAADIAAAKLDPDNQWAAIRAVRNAQLAATDWTQMPDSPLSDADKKAMALYRQKLRDIPQTATHPDQIDVSTATAIPATVALSKNAGVLTYSHG